MFLVVTMTEHAVTSDELGEFVRGLFDRGGHAVSSIQDVQEALPDGSPLRDEAVRLRRAYGNFRIERALNFK